MCRIAKAAFALLVLLCACGERLPEYPRRNPPEGFLGEPANRLAGREIFLGHCARCHGHPEEGRSPRADFFRPPAPDFSEPRYRGIDPAYLFWRIEVGKSVEPFLSRGSVMPAWGPHFSEEQIWQIVAYLLQRGGAG